MYRHFIYKRKTIIIFTPAHSSQKSDRSLTHNDTRDKKRPLWSAARKF